MSPAGSTAPLAGEVMTRPGAVPPPMVGLGVAPWFPPPVHPAKSMQRTRRQEAIRYVRKSGMGTASYSFPINLSRNRENRQGTDWPPMPLIFLKKSVLPPIAGHPDTAKG